MKLHLNQMFFECKMIQFQFVFLYVYAARQYVDHVFLSLNTEKVITKEPSIFHAIM